MGRVCMLLGFSLISCILAQDNPQVATPLGIIEGTIQKTYTGRTFFQFEGVPYAAPPVGKWRFENPRNPQKWKGILKATTKTLCIQYNQFRKEPDGSYSIIGDEDCLYYNVYTPTLNQSAKLDVLIYIHGGAYMFGSGGEWRPDIILNRPLVYVSINYRLGPLGFLSTEDNILPGNLGLRDQQQAFKSIQKNIKYFGGNPNSITLYGFSAGSSSIQAHCVSPSSKGLFHRGIMASGSILNNWALMEKPLEKAKRLASLVGCPTSSSIKLKNCMKSKPARLILRNIREFQPFLYNPFSPWAVVVDGPWASDPVLPEHPLILLRQGKISDVPLIVSFTTSEGLYPATDFYAKDEYLEAINTRWNEVMPFIMMYNDTVDQCIMDTVSQSIRRKYLGKSALNRRTFSGLVQAISDRCFVADIEKGLRLHSAGVSSPVWSYMYNYRPNESLLEGNANSTDNLGVSHGDDVTLILRNTLIKAPATRDDIAMSNLLLDMIMSFILEGAPNISTSWEPVSQNVLEPVKLLKINRYDDLQLLKKTYIGKRPFWDSLPFNENEKLLNITLGF